MFHRLYQYNHSTNEKLIRYLNENSVDHKQVSSWMSHLLNAHLTWLSRLRGEASPFAVWQEHERSQWLAINQQAWETTQQFLDDTDDLTQTIVYQNTKGTSFKNRVDDILWHVLNHSTHHRGQISTVIRQQGLTPEPMDYIFYVRKEREI
ncbi:DinB family protein [Tunicatimonas pelagia]|uniref:DinB family protein n=1 Tax=Tunicatimonas pelagia TaxID=931531 RepID=UPI002666FF37|nr:DinB family protein [Tunicatimonas pelagia]WKN41209.1 DinB family protein [Tunicatimonas pelagia]